MLHLAISPNTISNLYSVIFPSLPSNTRPNINVGGSYVCNLNVVFRRSEGGVQSPYFLKSSPLPLKRFNPRRFVSIPSPDSERWANYTFIERLHYTCSQGTLHFLLLFLCFLLFLSCLFCVDLLTFMKWGVAFKSP